jgi:hypothetical protein
MKKALPGKVEIWKIPKNGGILKVSAKAKDVKQIRKYQIYFYGPNADILRRTYTFKIADITLFKFEKVEGADGEGKGGLMGDGSGQGQL